MALQLEHWPIERLIAYARNPRNHDHAVERMADVIREYGFRAPLVVRGNGELVDGHLRLKAARRLGLAEVPVVLADDLSDAQVQAFRLLANRSATWATWDDNALRLELQDLQAHEVDLALTGFSGAEIAALLSQAVDMIGLIDEDDAPALPDEPITRCGDVWQCGPHLVLCGDATDPADYTTLIGDERAAMVFTDPPYNVDYANSAKDKQRGKHRPIRNDALGAAAFHDLLLAACMQMLSFTDGAIYIAMSSSELDTLQRAFRAAGGHWSTFIVWAKHTFTLGRSDYQRQYEPILYGWREGADRFWCGARDQGDVWFVDKPLRNPLHPTMKPVALVERAIANSAPPQAIVLDPFAGSGSTLIACEKTGRRARLMELEPKYVDVIVRRWQAYAGQPATRRLDGASFEAAALAAAPVSHSAAMPT
jgi:DNA modification methylase